jgi:hypothetical protein
MHIACRLYETAVDSLRIGELSPDTWHNYQISQKWIRHENIYVPYEEFQYRIISIYIRADVIYTESFASDYNADSFPHSCASFQVAGCCPVQYDSAPSLDIKTYLTQGFLLPDFNVALSS